MEMPLLRFKRNDGSEYPDWEKKKIGNILHICHGKDYRNYSVGKYPVVGTGGIMTYIDHYNCDWACALIGRKGSIDKPQFWDTPFWAIDTIFYSKPEKNENPKWQYYLFHVVNWKAITTGLRPSLTVNDIENVDVLVPCPEEQQKIADFLSDIDNQIENYQQSLNNLESQKKELLRQVFSQELRFTKNDGSEYPDWETDIIKNLLIVERGGSPRPIDKYITTSEDGLNWIKIGDTSPKENIIRSTKEKIIPEGLKKTRQVFKGDLILSNSMSYGRPYILDIDGCIHDGWLLIRDINNRFNKQFLCYALGSDIVQKQYRSLANGTTVKNLNKDLVNSVELIFPCLEEQQKIADFFTDFDNRIELERQRLQTMQEIKKGLLQQMFC